MDPDTALPAELLPVATEALARHGGLVAIFDPEDRLHWANAAFRLSLDVPDIPRISWAELMRHCHAVGRGAAIDAEDFEHWLASAASRRGKRPYRQFEADLRDGRWILMTETMDHRGWMLCIGVDVTDLGNDHRHLRVERDLALRASQVDPLTGIANRGAVLQRLAEALHRRQPPAVALIDLDHFKQINDQHGHAAGDQVLRDFAERLQHALRRSDACGRVGGEEFLVVLDGLTITDAQEVMQRLLLTVRGGRALPALPGFVYTASIGLVHARPGERPEDVMARADLALYAAKRGGRDTCVALP
ncbi:MAG: diguanylate cyclase [Burkholderiales bacterium]|nr:diguanylate cyclase [Burkholderiales bacterium]